MQSADGALDPDDFEDSPLDLSVKQSSSDHSTTLSTKPSTESSSEVIRSVPVQSTNPIKKKKTEKSYSNATLTKTVNSIRDGNMTVHFASLHHGIPRGTLQYRLSERYKHKGTTGPYTVLSSEEERHIVQYLKDMERKGFGVTRRMLIQKVACYLKQNPRDHSFPNNRPGKGWLRSFLHRHSDLKVRTAEAVTAASARVSESDIRKWFDNVRSYLMDNNLLSILDDPSRILNGDETGFCLNPVAKKVIATKGSKNVSIVETGSSKQNITVMFTFCADGTALPPDVILEYKKLKRDLVQSFPKEWGLGTSENGWMDTKNFALYVTKVVYRYLVAKRVRFPVLYFVDGHKSHTSIEVAEACSKLGIILVALYPNSTRILQPADVAVFRPLKSCWTDVVEEWKVNKVDAIVKLTDFGTLLEKAMERAFKPSTIMNGFAACGLSPYNPDAVDYSKCIAKNVEHLVHNTGCDVNSPEMVIHLETEQEDTLQVESVQNEIIQEDNIQEIFPNTTSHEEIFDKAGQGEILLNETDYEITRGNETINYLVSARDMDDALEMLGTSKIRMFNEESGENFSPEDKVLAFMYKKILKQRTADWVPWERDAIQMITIPPHEVDLLQNDIVDVSCDAANNDVWSTALELSTDNSADCTGMIEDIPIPTQSYDTNNFRALPAEQAVDGRYIDCEQSIESRKRIVDVSCDAANNDVWSTALELCTDNSADCTGMIEDVPIPTQSYDTNNFRALPAEQAVDGRYIDCEQPIESRSKEILMDITNDGTRLERKRSAASFFTCPATPKRSKAHRNYKTKFFPILTAGERLEELQRVEEEKTKAVQQRREKAEKRAQRKQEIEKLKETTREQRKEKAAKRLEEKVEAEKLKEKLREEKRLQTATRKLERENLRKQKLGNTAAMKRKKLEKVDSFEQLISNL